MSALHAHPLGLSQEAPAHAILELKKMVQVVVKLCNVPINVEHAQEPQQIVNRVQIIRIVNLLLILVSVKINTSTMVKVLLVWVNNIYNIISLRLHLRHLHGNFNKLHNLPAIYTENINK